MTVPIVKIDCSEMFANKPQVNLVIIVQFTVHYESDQIHFTAKVKC